MAAHKMEGQKILMTLMGMEIGGAETHVLELCKALTKRGMRVYVASNGGAYEPELKACGIIHYKVPMHKRRLENILYAYYALRRIIRDNDIRLVHAHARIPGFLCGLLQKKLRFRFVTTAHWVFSTEFPLNRLSDWGEMSLAVSKDVKQYLIDNYRFPEKNIRVTVNGIDTDKFSPETDYTPLRQAFGLTAGQLRILSLSRLDKDRSLPAHLLIQAAPALYRAHPSLLICIVGDGDDMELVRREADEMNRKLGAPVILLAGQSTEVNRWMASADVFVNSSRSALEAMSAGKPVVACGDEGYLGILTAENLPVAIETNFCFRGCGGATAERLTADLLTLLALSPAERAQLGAQGRELVKGRYSVARMADDALAVYEKVLYSPWPERLARPYKTDVVISGYYGNNNSGDDILLQSIIDNLRAYRPNINILVLSMRPKETRRQYGVSAVYRFNFLSIYWRLRRANLLITGGGTLIQDETSTQSLLYYLWVINTARRLGVKNMLYANGIGPVIKPGNINRVCETLNKVDLITLRDSESLQVLRDFGVTEPETHVTADAAFSLPSADEEAARACLRDMGITKPFFCVSLRGWMHNPPGLEREVAAFADYVTDTYGYQALFVPMRPVEDAEISKRTLALMKNPGVLMKPMTGDIDYIRGVTGLSEFVLGMRLHALIYAVDKGVPVIGLVYSPKIRQVMISMGQNYYMPVETANARTLIGYADAIHADLPAIKAEIMKIGKDAREKAALNTKLCTALLERP